MRSRNLLTLFAGLVLGLILAAQLPLHAQKPALNALAADAPVQEAPHEVANPAEPAPAPTSPAGGKVSIQDALLRPYTFPFGKPTTLAEVTRRLTADLGGPVVLDLAALDRLELKPDDSVELDLKGVRLKTGLKLLLDQRGLTYRLVPEDNLLILTDKEGSDDPLDRIWTELSHLHRDVHDIQDVVEELYDLTGADMDSEDGRLRQPTIIEEMPQDPGAAPTPAPGAGPNPGPKHDAPPESSRDARPSNPPKRPRTRL
jgi:hypothetical protein